MSQGASRSISKNLEPARPLKSNIKQTQQAQPSAPLYYASVQPEVHTSINYCASYYIR